MMDAQIENAPPPGSGGAPEGDRHHLLPGDRVNETGSAAEQNSLLSAARTYLARGLTPLRLAVRDKKPYGKPDENTVTAENAAELLTPRGRDLPFNLGLRLGPEHGGLVDFDLDWPEARRLADLFLFAGARFGRFSAPGSHRLYTCPGLKGSKKFDIPELKGVEGLPEEHAVCVLEVRASGHTMAPPSVHPCGEPVVWESDRKPPEDSPEGIHQKAGLLAFLSVVARFYPAQGSRDTFCMALAGALLSAGLPPEEADKCIVAVAELAGDEEAGKRRKAGQTSVKVEAGEPATGIPTVVEMLGLPEAVTKRFRTWLGVSEGRADGRVRVAFSENRLDEMLVTVEDAVLAAGLPIYQQMARVVRPGRLGGGALIVRTVQADSLRALMTRAVNFVVEATDAEGRAIDKAT